MRTTQRPTLRLRDIFAAGFEARGPDPWHSEPGPDGRYDWHASALGGCARKQILARAKARDDGTRLEGLLTFEIGHSAHKMLEEFCLAYAAKEPSFTVIASEQGGHHPTMPLAARCDLIYALDGVPYILDLKTESANAGSYRRGEAKDRTTAAKPEHQLQLAATAMVCEALGIVGGHIESGFILYLNKESGEFDEQPVALDETARDAILDRLAYLERAWALYEFTGELPPRLPDQANRYGKMRPSGLCRARGDDDPRGYYCKHRSVCMEMPA